jgi:hypothetical protein
MGGARSRSIVYHGCFWEIDVANPSVRDHCLAPSRTSRPSDVVGARSYARLFPEVPAFSADEAFLYALGRGGGVCDCGDGTDEPGSESQVAAGWPIFGQFVAHDITGDRSAPTVHADVGRLRNARTPQLNLESLYGDGPTGHPFLYQREDPAKFLLASEGGDLPRNAEGIAIVGDPRDDSHMLVSQFHLAMLKVHNAFVDHARGAGVPESRMFDEAAAETRRSYHWIVLHEFLPTLVGQATVDEVLANRQPHFAPEREPFIPLEFADAAYRYGHCQIRHRYRVNQQTEPVPLFPDLLGFRPVPAECRVDWSLFFDAPDRTTAQRAKKIDGKLVGSLIQLPVAVTGECEIDEYHSLAVRDLQRGQGVGLPSGESLARYLGIEPLRPEEVGLGSTNWRGETPLWYYILREADARAGGNRLGPLGGRIVAEVLIGLLRADPTSILYANQDWQPAFADGGRASLAQLLGWAEAN